MARLQTEAFTRPSRWPFAAAGNASLNAFRLEPPLRSQLSPEQEKPMVNLVVLVLCLALGTLLARTGRLPADAHKTLNAFIINIALPALILRHVHDLHHEARLLLPASMPWVPFAFGALFFAAIGRIAGWPRRTTGALILSGALANTSFVGLPMIESFYGSEYLGIGILVDQLGNLPGAQYDRRLRCRVVRRGQPRGVAALLRKIATFPPFQALVLALLARSPTPRRSLRCWAASAGR